MATTNPAIAGSILRNFSIAAVSIAGGVFGVYRIVSIASTKQMAGGERGQLRLYNARVHPEQDRLDTIFDRTKLLNAAKEKKPWNMTLAEKERTRM